VLDARLERLVRAADLDDRRDFIARVFDARDLLEVVRVGDFFEPERWALVSPFSRRILFTVRAATSSARAPYRPDFLALCLIFSYCRSRFGLAPLGIESSLPWC
jgi:hypothetical protein